MKKKITFTITITLITIAIIGTLIYGYFKIIGIESKPPKDEKNMYSLETEKYLDRKVFVIKPNDKHSTSMTILYLHGGAYVGELQPEHWEFIGKIVTDTGATVIVPDYPLAPKYTYIDVFNMIEPLYGEIADKVGENNIVVMGDSAGGGIGLALVEKISEDSNYNIPSKTILISPWLDVRMTNPEIEKVQENDKELNRETLRLAGLSYAGIDGIDSKLVNPIDGDISKLRNVTIFTGTYDILNPDVHKLMEKSVDLGDNIKVKEYEGAGHIWIVNRKGDKELIDRAYNDLIQVLKTESQ